MESLSEDRHVIVVSPDIDLTASTDVVNGQPQPSNSGIKECAPFPHAQSSFADSPQVSGDLGKERPQRIDWRWRTDLCGRIASGIFLTIFIPCILAIVSFMGIPAIIMGSMYKHDACIVTSGKTMRYTDWLILYGCIRIVATICSAMLLWNPVHNERANQIVELLNAGMVILLFLTYLNGCISYFTTSWQECGADSSLRKFGLVLFIFQSVMLGGTVDPFLWVACIKKCSATRAQV